MTSETVEGTWIGPGCYLLFRDKWVNPLANARQWRKKTALFTNFSLLDWFSANQHGNDKKLVLQQQGHNFPNNRM